MTIHLDSQNSELIKKLKELNKQASVELTSLNKEIQSNPEYAKSIATQERTPDFIVKGSPTPEEAPVNIAPKTNNKKVKEINNDYLKKDLIKTGSYRPPKKPKTINSKGNSQKVFQNNIENFKPLN